MGWVGWRGDRYGSLGCTCLCHLNQSLPAIKIHIPVTEKNVDALSAVTDQTPLSSHVIIILMLKGEIPNVEPGLGNGRPASLMFVLSVTTVFQSSRPNGPPRQDEDEDEEEEEEEERGD